MGLSNQRGTGDLPYSHFAHGKRRQATQHPAAEITLGEPAVETRNASPVSLGAHTTTDPLKQAQSGGRHHQLVEGTAPIRFHEFRPGLVDGVGWWCERQLADEKLSAQTARKVQALTERLEPEEDRRLAGLDTPSVLGVSSFSVQ